MTRIKLALFGSVSVLTVFWLFADTLVPQPFTYFTFRDVFIQYSGVVAMGSMSIALLLALRPRRLEPGLGGLDKMYRLHKWLGITVLVGAVMHWWWTQGTKWMVGWGWLTRPPRGARPDPSTLGTVEALLRAQRGLAETVGEWAFYFITLMLVLALVKRFPYHLFAKTHKWLAVGYLVLVFHTVVLTKISYWSQPVGWLLAALLATGTVAAMRALFDRIGVDRRVGGTLEAIEHYPALDVLESRIALQPGWPGHAAGQFAFVTSDQREGAHPYTIASAWNPAEPSITFITKALGDHTGRLRERLKVGMPVTVEGPYGGFDFEDGRVRQIWIGAGIGITPFVARMKHLAASPQAGRVDLFHATSVREPAAIDKLTADAQAAQVQLHLFVSGKDERLDGARMRAVVPDWKDASVWFCGPKAFGRELRADLVAHGLAPARFHQELFEMR